MSASGTPVSKWVCPRCGQHVGGRIKGTPKCNNKDKHPRPITMTKEQDA